MEEKKEKNLNFFTRMKIAITKLEDYPIFAEESTTKAVKYFFLIVLIFVAMISIVATYTIKTRVERVNNYIKDEISGFSYEAGNLELEEQLDIYNEQEDFYFLSNTNSDENLSEMKHKIKSAGIIFLKDKAIYKVGSYETEYPYTQLFEEVSINDFDKDTLVQKLNSINTIPVLLVIFVLFVFSMYVYSILVFLLDWLIVSIFAFIASRICRVGLKFKQTWNISIYALTLPIFISLIYNVVQYFTDFYTQYFRMIYLLIADVYVIAAIFMMKSDAAKQMIGIEKEVQITKEDEIKDEEEKDDEVEEPKSDETDDNEMPEELPGEPDGSEI